MRAQCDNCYQSRSERLLLTRIGQILAFILGRRGGEFGVGRLLGGGVVGLDEGNAHIRHSRSIGACVKSAALKRSLVLKMAFMEVSDSENNNPTLKTRKKLVSDLRRNAEASDGFKESKSARREVLRVERADVDEVVCVCVA